MTERIYKAILLVDHGSRLDEANEMLQEVARLIREEDGGYHVAVAHMELAEPTIEQGLAGCVAAGALDITVHPYLLAPGRHATGDIPRLVRKAIARHPDVTYRVTRPLGLHRLLARVVLERVREAEAAGETLSAGAGGRASPKPGPDPSTL